MNGGKFVDKETGNDIRILDQSMFGTTITSWLPAPASRVGSVCMHWVRGNGPIQMTLYFQSGGNNVNTRTLSGQPGYMCVSRYHSYYPNEYPTYVQVMLGSENSSIHVDTFYGKP